MEIPISCRTNGGGVYDLIFIITMVIIGIPMILVENVIERRAYKNKENHSLKLGKL